MAQEEPGSAPSGTPQRTDVAQYYVDGVITTTDGKDFQLIFTKRIPTYPTATTGESEPAITLNMSRGTAADLQHSIKSVLDQLIERFGAVDTPYLAQERKAAK